MTNETSATKPTDMQQNVTQVLDSIAQKRSVIPVIFALIVVLFFFGFCDFKCNSVKVASLSGINMVTGTHVKTTAGNMMNDSFNAFDNSRQQSSYKGEKVNPNFWAILAFLMAIGGAAAYYKKIKSEALAGAAAGAIGFLSLIFLRFAIKNKIEEQGGGMVSIEIDFLFAYWVSLIGFLAAGGLSYLRWKQEKEKVKEGTSPVAAKGVTPLQVNIITNDETSRPR